MFRSLWDSLLSRGGTKKCRSIVDSFLQRSDQELTCCVCDDAYFDPNRKIAGEMFSFYVSRYDVP